MRRNSYNEQSIPVDNAYKISCRFQVQKSVEGNVVQLDLSTLHISLSHFVLILSNYRE